MQKITEEMGLHKEWYIKAKAIEDLDQLKIFLSDLMFNYEHDYGTIIHAVAAGAIATIHAINRGSPFGGISGFQAGAIALQIWCEFLHVEGPFRVVEYHDMLFPQYKNKFDKTMTYETFSWLKEKAQKFLENPESLHPKVKKHLKTIVNGKVPFGFKLSKEE